MFVGPIAVSAGSIGGYKSRDRQRALGLSIHAIYRQRSKDVIAMPEFTRFYSLHFLPSPLTGRNIAQHPHLSYRSTEVQRSLQVMALRR